MESSVDLVLAYVNASQRARSSQDPADFEAIRQYLADEVLIRLAGPDVLVEQISTLHTHEGDKTSCVAHLFTVVDNRITGIRTYRNDVGLPAG